jgi:alpha-L-fucosidase
LLAKDGYIHNNDGSKQAEIKEHDGVPHVGYWVDNRAWVDWSIEIDKPGRYEVLATMSVAKKQTQFNFGFEGETSLATVASTGSYGDYQQNRLGVITVVKSGQKNFRILPQPKKWQPMNLRQVTLQRVE